VRKPYSEKRAQENALYRERYADKIHAQADKITKMHVPAFAEYEKTQHDLFTEVPAEVTCFEDVKLRFKDYGQTHPSPLYHGSPVAPWDLQPIDGCEGPTLASPEARGVFGSKGEAKWGDAFTWANVQLDGMLEFINNHYHWLRDEVDFYIYICYNFQ
jgi:hypothetical protein